MRMLRIMKISSEGKYHPSRGLAHPFIGSISVRKIRKLTSFQYYIIFVARPDKV
jgi:hypothetical protein